LQNAEAGLFFFAGHGLQVAGQNYLIPVDAALTSAVALDFETVSVNVIQRAMESATNTNLLFLDACRNNPLARNLARAMGTRSAEIGRGFAPIVSGVGTLISFSTQPGNVALDGKGRNSPFAAALVKELAAPTDDLSAMLIDVRNEVMALTQNKQVPWEHSALTGSFYFTAARPELVASDETTWSLIKDTRDLALLRRFIEQFPSSKRRAEAEQRIVELEQVPAAAISSTAQAKKASTPVPGATTDEVAWSLIKDTKEPALLRRFIEQFPASKRRAEAEHRAASLPAGPKPTGQKNLPGTKSSAVGGKCFTFDGRHYCE
jgi:hypothetical protein